MNRVEFSKMKYKELFQQKMSYEIGDDPELMEILQKFIFGEVFQTGNISDRERELITIVLLTIQQTLPQLKAHTNAALNIGVTPLEIREAVYQCAPFIGFPKVLNAVATINEVFKERGNLLPLESAKTVTEEDRFQEGFDIQFPIYGDEIKNKMATLPDGLNEALPRFLTEMCFGDFYTRKALDIKTRELLVLCGLVAINANPQIQQHGAGNLKVGNSKETLISAILHCLPYIGFPYAINAVNVIKDLKEVDNYEL